MLLRERSTSTGQACPHASSTRRAVPEQTSRRTSRRSPSSSRGRCACAAARSCRSSARWPCAPCPLRTRTAARGGRTSQRTDRVRKRSATMHEDCINPASSASDVTSLGRDPQLGHSHFDAVVPAQWRRGRHFLGVQCKKQPRRSELCQSLGTECHRHSQWSSWHCRSAREHPSGSARRTSGSAGLELRGDHRCALEPAVHTIPKAGFAQVRIRPVRNVGRLVITWASRFPCTVAV